MRRLAALLSLTVLLLAGCGDHGARQYQGSASAADATYGSCAFCHTALAVHMTDAGGHGSLELKCEVCHKDLIPGQAGPGHRSVPACADCHQQQMTHQDPAAGTTAQCTVCHTPHGSFNLNLINAHIFVCAGGDNAGAPCLTDDDCPGGSCTVDKPIQLCSGGDRNVEPCSDDSDCPDGTCAPGFTNYNGKADFSFATATYPGNGVCEVCHSGCPGGSCIPPASSPSQTLLSMCLDGSRNGLECTRFYQSGGTGADHFPFTCFTCHPHAAGFAPQ